MRSAPVHMARTTSLTVVPILFFSALASARLAAAKATRRRACTATLMEVRGAVSGRAAFAVSPWRIRRTSKMFRVVRSTVRPRSKGATRPAIIAWETNSRPEGMRESSWRAFCGGVSGGVGSRSKRTPSSSAPETPSMVLWCILMTRAIFPSSSPSTIHISQSGRSR